MDKQTMDLLRGKLKKRRDMCFIDGNEYLEGKLEQISFHPKEATPIWIRRSIYSHASVEGKVRLYELADRFEVEIEIELNKYTVRPDVHDSRIISHFCPIPDKSLSPNRQVVEGFRVQHVGFSIYSEDKFRSKYSLHLKPIGKK